MLFSRSVNYVHLAVGTQLWISIPDVLWLLTGIIKKGNCFRHCSRGFTSLALAKCANAQLQCVHNQNYKLCNVMVLRYMISTLGSRHRSITTHFSPTVNNEEVIQAFELFISSNKDENVSVEKLSSTYIEKLCSSGNLLDASYLMKYLLDKEIHLGLGSYNMLLDASVKANDFNMFSVNFKNLLISRLPPDVTSYENVANAFRLAADLDLIVMFIEEVSSLSSHTDPTVLNRIIYATAKSGQYDKSLKIFEVMKNLQCIIDKVTFNTILVILGRAGQVDKMLNEFKLMKESEHCPDLITYSTLINCLRRLGRLDLCKKFLEEMLEKGIKVDLLTYTAIIDSLGRAGHIEEALAMFYEMKKYWRPSLFIYRALISNSNKAGKFEVALKLTMEMKSSETELAGPEDFKQRRKGKSKDKARSLVQPANRVK